MKDISTTYSVLEARLVSSCFSCPSSARPHLSLLLASSGVSVNTFESVNPGATWHPSLLLDDVEQVGDVGCGCRGRV